MDATALLPVVIEAKAAEIRSAPDLAQATPEQSPPVAPSGSNTSNFLGGSPSAWSAGGSRTPAHDFGDPSALIELCAGTRIWLAAGVTDMKRGFHGLSAGAYGAPRAAVRWPRHNAVMAFLQCTLNSQLRSHPGQLATRCVSRSQRRPFRIREVYDRALSSPCRVVPPP